MVRNKRDAEGTRRKILDTAEQLFAEKGYAGTTLREISEACGVSGPLMVFHFNDKQGVYDSVKARIVRRYIETNDLCTPRGGSFNHFIEYVISAMFRFYRDNPTMMRLATWGRLEGDIAPWPGEDEWHHVYLDRIQKAQKEGEIRDDLTPLNIAIMISGAVHLWWEYHEHFVRHMNPELETEAVDDLYLRQCVSFVRQGLAKEKNKRGGKTPRERKQTGKQS